MFVAQAPSSVPNPILPAGNEAVWTVALMAFAILVILLFVLLLRWAGFHLGYQLGRLRRRGFERP